MLTAYRDEAGQVRAGGVETLPDGVVWIDLLEPTDEERSYVEARSGTRLPSREALSEIESTSRLRVEHGTLYLSTPIVARGDMLAAELSPVGFVLKKDLLVTIRYAKLPTFDAVAAEVGADEELASGAGVFTALLEAIVDRGADVLEHLGAELDRVSRTVFRGDPHDPRHAARSTSRLRDALATVGSIGERVSQARDVLLGVGRIAGFTLEICHGWIEPELHTRIEAVSRDVASLNDYEAHVAGKVQFLLDAILGYITIEQNDLFKILTIASVVGVPPTLLAGVWGMNFKAMPELDWPLGYPLALAMIVLSALLPLVWFKVRGWF